MDTFLFFLILAAPGIIFVIVLWDDIKNYDPFHINEHIEYECTKARCETLKEFLDGDHSKDSNSEGSQTKEGKCDKEL